MSVHPSGSGLLVWGQLCFGYRMGAGQDCQRTGLTADQIGSLPATEGGRQKFTSDLLVEDICTGTYLRGKIRLGVQESDSGKPTGITTTTLQALTCPLAQQTRDFYPVIPAHNFWLNQSI